MIVIGGVTFAGAGGAACILGSSATHCAAKVTRDASKMSQHTSARMRAEFVNNPLIVESLVVQHRALPPRAAISSGGRVNPADRRMEIPHIALVLETGERRINRRG
jgi:hypothetical protein